jgi:HK97 family phage prohead protease
MGYLRYRWFIASSYVYKAGLMPYFITDESPDCPAWAVVKEDGEVLACHETEQSATDQMIAVSLAEGLEPGGTYTAQNRDSSEHESTEAAEARATEGRNTDPCEDCDGACEVCSSESQEETRQVNLAPPAYMRAAARQGLKYYEEGLGGDGLVPRTIREARAMASGTVSEDKWIRLRAWIARHLDDLDSADAKPGADGYPSAGVVAHLLWGSGPSKTSARRALTYAEGVVARIEQENEGRMKGNKVSQIEQRVNTTEFEVREEGDGMHFSGYAALFESPSQPLPFTEKIARGAFKRSLRARNDIKFLWNHDSGEILGSTRAGTLTLSEDDRGLKVEGMLPNTSRGRDVAELLRRGDVDAMSFGFSVPQGGDTWSADGSERTLKSVRLHEVSVVAWPAYTATAGTVSVRKYEKTAERAEVNADALADALLKIEDGLNITSDEQEMLSRVINTLAPEPEAVESEPEVTGDVSMLELKKKKLELLMKGI